MFTIGGLSGVVLANASLDIAFHDKHLVLFSITLIVFTLTVNNINIENRANNAEYIKMF
jgi:heme/copper-type cytochrome/quinol oxidase subunit 1